MNDSIQINIECGLFSKQYETGVRMAYELFVENKEYIVLDVDSTYMKLDQIRIAFGPYIAGFVMAIIAFCGEYYFLFIISLKQKLFIINGNLMKCCRVLKATFVQLYTVYCNSNN